MRIEPASPGDAAVLTQIAFAAKRHWGYPEGWIESWREVLTIDPQFISAHTTRMAIRDGRAVGFYALQADDKRLDLQHLWVLPDFRGRGVGRALFGHAVAMAEELGYTDLMIESDPNAEGFYRRMGARRVETNNTVVDGQFRALPILIFKL